MLVHFDEDNSMRLIFKPPFLQLVVLFRKQLKISSESAVMALKTQPLKIKRRDIAISIDL